MKSIDDFKDVDIYSLAMFILYKLVDVQEFSIMGELPYILDKKSLLNFCNYFGGRTIKVPTLNELYSTMHLILLYHYINVDKKSFDEAFKLVGYKDIDRKKIVSAYEKIDSILNKYQFGEN